MRTTSDSPDLAAVISAILPSIAAQADVAERDRKVQPEIIIALAEAGAIHALVP